MQHDLIVAGVGGQGILTIAQAISEAALRRGWNVKQAEVHGMSQRGGAVQSHLRYADHVLHSDLVSRGAAHVILATEPLEALRYVEYLSEQGTVVSSSVPVVNIPNYPPLESTLDRISRYAGHVLIDPDRLARAAGSARTSNMVMLGAVSTVLKFEPAELEQAIASLLRMKGDRIIAQNQLALRLGRQAATLYREALGRGASPRAIRQWLESIPAESLGACEQPHPGLLNMQCDTLEMASEEEQAVLQILRGVQDAGRTRLFEHEVYRLVELVGAISPPRHVFIPRGQKVADQQLAEFRGDQVVLKIIAQDIVHKTENRGLAFVANRVDIVNRELQALIHLQELSEHDIEGVLVAEFVQHDRDGLDSELFVGIRATREFGPVIAAGLGGVDTEYLAAAMKPGLAIAQALALETTADEFFSIFRNTAAYDVLSGRVRGHSRVVSDGELVRCFRAFIGLARKFCVYQADDRPALVELEANPFAFRNGRLIPLDGRGLLGEVVRTPPARPLARLQGMLEPRAIAVLGVSAKRANFGRLILDNILACGFPAEHVYVVKPGAADINGVRCVPDLASLPEHIDLLVAATGADQLPRVIDDVIATRNVSSVILIPGGLGEKEGTESLQTGLRNRILLARKQTGQSPVFLGGNSMGVLSRPGRYDTFFISPSRLDMRRQAAPRPIALVSQSGAFIITRLSNLQYLDPKFAISVGNQTDLTTADLFTAVASRDDIDCIGLYLEGFNDLDGLALVRAFREACSTGKTVVAYKAGRTPRGRSAAMGHTASLAGDHEVCQAALAAAGAIITDTFKEFEQLLELAVALHHKHVAGKRIGVLSNAGYETVGMADAIQGARYSLEMPELAAPTARVLVEVMRRYDLDRLVNVRNPLDLTPMATDQAYEDCIRVMMAAGEFDALVVSVVPMTTRLLTTAAELGNPESIARRLPRLFHEASKPIIFVLDSGPAYEPLSAAVRSAGMPLIHSSDQAIRSLGRYLCHRSRSCTQPVAQDTTCTPTRKEVTHALAGSSS